MESQAEKTKYPYAETLKFTPNSDPTTLTKSIKKYTKSSYSHSHTHTLIQSHRCQKEYTH